VLEGLKSQMNRLRHLTVRALDQTKLIKQHGAIVDALRQKDAEMAEQAMRVHLRELLNDLPEIARNQPELFKPEEVSSGEKICGTRRSLPALPPGSRDHAFDQDPASFADGRMK
jgi:hypothetical protein